MTRSEPAATGLTTSRPSGGVPASVIRLSDGRIAIAWNPWTHVPPDPEPWQRLGRGTLAVALSSDEGETWSDPLPVAQASFVCYPRLLEHEPGQLLLSTGLLRARAIQDEYRDFLAKCGIEFDERMSGIDAPGLHPGLACAAPLEPESHAPPGHGSAP